LSYYYRTNGQTDYYRFVRQEIKRLRENTDCFLSINSASKAEQIEAALRYSIQDEVLDLQEDEALQDALAIPRIFNFWGCKPTQATYNTRQSAMSSSTSI
jgi:CHAD domain-containing protein